MGTAGLPLASGMPEHLDNLGEKQASLPSASILEITDT
jgi:hypothetical protein